MSVKDSKKDGFYPTKRIHVVIDKEGQIKDVCEQSIHLAKDWKCYLQKDLYEKECSHLQEKSKDEYKFISKWQGKEGYDIISGLADNLEVFLSSIPEFSRRHPCNGRKTL